MKKIILYIKTYRKDFEVFLKLLESIEKHNRDNIPVLISVNNDDFSFFRSKIDPEIEIIRDKDILESTVNDGWRYQQIVKSSLHNLNICENYVCIDSDSYFIRDFFVSDFMFDSSTPYTVMHQQKELFSWSSINYKRLKVNPKLSFLQERKFVMEKFGRKSTFYDFGPSPVIWSCYVWESFHKNYLKSQEKTFEEIIIECPSEFSWYGEWLLYSKIIPIYPLEPLFKVFHYEQQYRDYLGQGHTEETIKENYLGIVKQSNWNIKKKWYKF